MKTRLDPSGYGVTARAIIKAEYGDARNLITARVLGYGRLPFGAYELSTGSGIEPGSVGYGVSVVQLLPDGTTRRLIGLSTSFWSQTTGEAHLEALAYIAFLRRMQTPPLELEEAWDAWSAGRLIGA